MIAVHKCLKDSKLAVFLLLLSLKVQPQYRFIHNSCHQKHFVYFFRLGNAAEFVMECDCYFGFENVILLFSGCHILSVSKHFDNVKL